MEIPLACCIAAFALSRNEIAGLLPGAVYGSGGIKILRQCGGQTSHQPI